MFMCSLDVASPLTLFQVQCYNSCLTCCTIGSSACPDNSAVMFTVLAPLAITSHYIILITQTLTFEWYYVQNSGTEKKGSFSFRVFYLSVLLNCLFSHNTFHTLSQWLLFFQKPWKTLQGPASARIFFIRNYFLYFSTFTTVGWKMYL